MCVEPSGIILIFFLQITNGSTFDLFRKVKILPDSRFQVSWGSWGNLAERTVDPPSTP